SASLDAEIAAAGGEIADAARDLTALRQAGARSLRERVLGELPSLALPEADFDVSVEPAARPSEHGSDAIELRFSAHRSLGLGALSRVASGGELSRAMIAVTLALAADAGTTGVLVFDEADAGVGGRAALELGRRLARLASGRQVLAVTHLA